MDVEMWPGIDFPCIHTYVALHRGSNVNKALKACSYFKPRFVSPVEIFKDFKGFSGRSQRSPPRLRCFQCQHNGSHETEEDSGERRERFTGYLVPPELIFLTSCCGSPCHPDNHRNNRQKRHKSSFQVYLSSLNSPLQQTSIYYKLSVTLGSKFDYAVWSGDIR